MSDIQGEPSYNSMKYSGLTTAQVEENRRNYGANVITPPQRTPWWKLYLEKYQDPVIRILLIAAFIAIVTGIFNNHYIEGIGIITAVLLATTIAFLNEYKANKEFDLLNKVNDEVPIKVIRNGTYDVIPKKDIVVEDIVLVEIGEEIPADGVLLEAVSLQVDESKLTGESIPSNKKTVEDVQSTSTYQANRLFRGTMVVDGHGIYKISGVGDNTEIGKTSKAATEITSEKSPLNKQLEELSKRIGVVGLFVAVLTYVSLIILDIFNGNIHLTVEQLYFSIILHIGVAILLQRIWAPILFDFFDWLKVNIKSNSWFEEEGMKAWIKSIVGSLVVFGILLGLGILLKIVPQLPSKWITIHALNEFLDYFMIAVTIIVVAVPEGLAMSVTLSLAYSMRKMTASNNLVRKMEACETIGAATVICSDKTGTLTINEMRVTNYEFPCLKNDEKIDEIVIEAISCNSIANLKRENGLSKILGNPTEGSLLLWLNENRIDYSTYRTGFIILHQWTFSTEKKYMATWGKSSLSNKNYFHIKGAPEIVANMCTKILTKDGIEDFKIHKAEVLKKLEGYQNRGMRTLAFAYSDTLVEKPEADISSNNLIWLGFVAIMDPLRNEVAQALKYCKQAGIDVKIITGDNTFTAKEIGRQLEILSQGSQDNQHLTGEQFANKTDSEVKLLLNELKIMSRARPLDKLRLVKLLKENGHIVAVTGDGTNDAPALNHADVGLAMGKTGTSIAREASDIILLDDSFNSIINAVLWGRSLYENIQRFILFQLTINVAALGIALLGPFIGIQLPLTVTQMLWINLIMDTFAALALATEPPHENVLKRKPRKANDFIVTSSMGKNITIVGLSFVILFLIILSYIKADGVVTNYDLSIFFSIFVMLQFWNLFNARALNSSFSSFKGVLKNKGFMIIALSIFIGQILIVQYGGEIFRTEPISFWDWIYIICGTSVVLWIGEAVRFYSRIKNVKNLKISYNTIN